jgi:hypothetical protein
LQRMQDSVTTWVMARLVGRGNRWALRLRPGRHKAQIL